MRNQTNVTYENFMNELQQEYEYLKEGIINYRAETASMCLELAKNADDFMLFLDYDDTFEFVQKSLDVDTDRLKDVTKMLYTILGDLHLKANLSEKTKVELARRKANRKMWKLVPATSVSPHITG